METLYATPHGFAPGPKNTSYRPAVSVLSSPSARSSSSAGSQDDLLPELWLETPPNESCTLLYPASTSASVSASAFGHGTGACYANPIINHQPVPSFSNFASGLHSSPILRDESLEYAQSLLPNSLLFPLAGGGVQADENSLSCERAHSPLADGPFSGDISPSNCTSKCGSRSVAYTHERSHNCGPRRSSLGTSSTYSAKSRQNSASSVGSGTSASSKTSCRNLNTQLYKTELCASFMKSGTCPYGGKCQFAHGTAELKAVDRPSNWRSKPCTNWARTGSCRYGKRCCFKHGE